MSDSAKLPVVTSLRFRPLWAQALAEFVATFKVPTRPPGTHDERLQRELGLDYNVYDRLVLLLSCDIQTIHCLPKAMESQECVANLFSDSARSVDTSSGLHSSGRHDNLSGAYIRSRNPSLTDLWGIHSSLFIFHV